MDDVTTAYVPTEDVEKTIITERAISVQTVSDQTGTDGDYTDSSYTDTDTEDSCTEDTYTDSSYTEENYTGSSYTDTDTEDSYTEDTYTDNSYSGEGYPEAADYTESYDTGYSQPAAPEDGAVSDAPASAESEETVTAASSDDLSLLAAIIYCEAGNQSREGKVAVGAVVLNRVASSSFPNNIHDVIYQSGQFTPAYSGSLASALAGGVPGDCVEAAQAALNGENPVGGALYFNTGSGKGIKIGAHQFY